MELRWRKIKIRRTSREPSVPFDIFEKPRTMEKYNTHEIIFPTLFLYKFTLRSAFYSKSFAIHYDFSIMFIGCDIGACYVLIQNIARFRINKKNRCYTRGRKAEEKTAEEKWLVSYEEIRNMKLIWKIHRQWRMRRYAAILRSQFYRNTFIENTEKIYFISSLKCLIQFLFSINCQTIFDTSIGWKKYFLTIRLVIFLACSDTRWTEFNKVRSHPTHFPREFVWNKAAWKWTFPPRFCHIFFHGNRLSLCTVEYIEHIRMTMARSKD